VDAGNEEELGRAPNFCYGYLANVMQDSGAVGKDENPEKNSKQKKRGVQKREACT